LRLFIDKLIDFLYPERGLRAFWINGVIG